MPTSNHLNIDSPMMYTIFAISVLIMICIDLMVLKKTGDHKVSLKEAAIWSGIWVSVALLFNLWLWWHLRTTIQEGLDPAVQLQEANAAALNFLTGYLIEKALSVDNIFIFLMIFSYFQIPAKYQRRVLVYGILSAIILRVVMVLIGSALISRFEWILYFFGALLIYTGITMLKPEKEMDKDLSSSPILKILRKIIPMTAYLHEERFFIKEKDSITGKLKTVATPLFLVLLMINITDVVFAVDSVPAIFAITTDPFIVMTSNVFAILGLRAMYFLLADMADRFHLLSYGLAIILIFIGIKMVIIQWIHIPTVISLGTVLVVLIASITLSLYIPARKV